MVDNRELRREITALRGKLRRYQVYLAAALAVVGLSMAASVAVLALYGRELHSRVAELQQSIESRDADSKMRSKALALDLSRQRAELEALEDAARDDLLAIREAHRKLAANRTPGSELAQLREANEALWSALADQRQDLLTAFEEREEPAAPEATPEAASAQGLRFQLGETDFVDPTDGAPAAGLDGFVVGEHEVRRGSQGPTRPGHLVIELDPQTIRLGDLYQLAVRLVNRSNRPLDPSSLRLDWSFGGRKTGGDVPLGVARVDANDSAVLFHVSGRWTPAHETGPVQLRATLTLGDGGRLANTLSW